MNLHAFFTFEILLCVALTGTFVLAGKDEHQVAENVYEVTKVDEQKPSSSDNWKLLHAKVWAVEEDALLKPEETLNLIRDLSRFYATQNDDDTAQKQDRIQTLLTIYEAKECDLIALKRLDIFNVLTNYVNVVAFKNRYRGKMALRCLFDSNATGFSANIKDFSSSAEKYLEGEESEAEKLALIKGINDLLRKRYPSDIECESYPVEAIEKIADQVQYANTDLKNLVNLHRKNAYSYCSETGLKPKRVYQLLQAYLPLSDGESSPTTEMTKILLKCAKFDREKCDPEEYNATFSSIESDLKSYFKYYEYYVFFSGDCRLKLKSVKRHSDQISTRKKKSWLSRYLRK